ncbi:MAG: DUF975 family protein [Lachnospiraceae bacterium]|nr:DUF975 family protein [Lachnospiraceae bacterium]
MPYMTYTQLKTSAKARMTPVMGRLVGAAAIQIGCTFLISRVSSIPALFTNSFALQILLYFLSSILCGTLTGILEAGLCYLFLKLYCNRPFSAGDLFYAFTRQTKTCLGLSFIMSLISTIPTMPAYAFFLRFSISMEKMNLTAISSNMDASAVTIPPEMLNLLSIALFCYTPALIITTILDLIYSQVYYLMLDFPSCSVKELFGKSRLLMHGHKGRLFYIRVCFIPLILLGIMTCGIGMLWIAPFMYAVQTEFYLDLVTKRKV